jgi:Sulfatase-modifying factor enzyme 1
MVLQELLTLEATAEAEHGRPVIFAAEALLDMGLTNVSRPVALKVERALVDTMQSATCPIRTRRDAGNLLGCLGWTPEPDLQESNVILVPAGCDPTGLDVFCRVPGMDVWMGKYPVTTRQFARFMEADGYQHREFWSAEGWAWHLGTSDSQAPAWLQDLLKNRSPEKRNRPLWWDDRIWHSPLYPVVGVSWFEAEAYSRWLMEHTCQAANVERAAEVREGLRTGRLSVRLPIEAEWEAAMGGSGNYPWGDRFDATCLNCAESWAGQEFADDDAWRKWFGSDTESWREASLTAVTTYPQGVSSTGIWDGSGNAREWLRDSAASGSNTRPLRGGA